MNLLKTALWPGYRLLELAGGFALHQRLGQPTLERYRQLIDHHIGNTAGKHVFDIGCGIGNFRPYFAGPYTGIDINPAYIERARAVQSGVFETMDCTSAGICRRLLRRGCHDCNDASHRRRRSGVHGS